MFLTAHSVPQKNVPCIDLVLHIIQARVIAVGDNGLGLLFEGIQIVDYTAAKEGAAVFEGGFIDDDIGSLGLDTLHDALDGRLAEIVRAGLHRQAIDTDGD